MIKTEEADAALAGDRNKTAEIRTNDVKYTDITSPHTIVKVNVICDQINWPFLSVWILRDKQNRSLWKTISWSVQWRKEIQVDFVMMSI